MTVPLATAPSRSRLFACMMYEAVLLFGVVFLAGYLFDSLTQSRHALMHRHGRQAVLFLAIGLYFVMCWRYKGQTLPMKTWNIRLVDTAGQTPGAGKLVLRYIMVWPVLLLGASLVWLASWLTGWSSVDMFIVAVPFAAFIWTWLDKDGLFLHDRVARTRLVDATPRKSVETVI